MSRYKKPPSSIAVSLNKKDQLICFLTLHVQRLLFPNCARIGFNKACLRLKLALFTIKREDTLQISSKGSKPLARKVFQYQPRQQCNHPNPPTVQVSIEPYNLITSTCSPKLA